jgi:hypothetical protein
MTKTIANTETKLLIDDSVFAYKDGKLYQVWKTEKRFMCGSLLGNIRFVLDENGEELAVSYPLMGFNNDFKKVSAEEIELMRKIVQAFDNLLK